MCRAPPAKLGEGRKAFLPSPILGGEGVRGLSPSPSLAGVALFKG